MNKTKSQRFDMKLHELRSRQYTWMVTGAAGFIGSNLCQFLIKHQQRVIGVDNYITGDPDNIKELQQSYFFTFIEDDICNIGRELRKVDFVLHQAAIGSVPRSIEDPMLYHKNNVDGFFKLMLECKKEKVKKFVYASSSSVYGDDVEIKKMEESIGNVLSPYAATKRIDEIYANMFHRVYQFPAIGLRYFNVFGPRQRFLGDNAPVISKWITNMITKKPIFINGSETITRDFCYIDNAIQANILAAMSGNECNGEVFNVSCDDRITLKYLHKIISQYVSKFRPGLEIPPPIIAGFRKGDIHHSQSCIHKAGSMLGFKPDVFVERGIAETVKYYLNKE